MATLTQLELQLKTGIAVDLRQMREGPGLTLRPVAHDLGWTNWNELSRREKLDMTTGQHRDTSLEEYLQLMKHYLSFLPPDERSQHPATALLADPAYATIIKTMPQTALYLYLGMMRALALAQQIPATHPAVLLGNYLARIGAIAIRSHRG